VSVASVFFQTFRALRHRNFRLFYIGQLVSLVGSWMQMLAQGWLVWRLSHSSWILGALGFAQMGPVLFLGLFGGLVADHANRHRLVMITQSLLLLQAAILTVVTLAGVVQVWMVLVLAAFLGVVNAFDMSARQTFLLEMVEREDLSNAIALNSSLFNGARIVGPAVAGFVVGLWGEGVCFGVNAASYLAVLLGLVLMRFPERRPPPPWNSRFFGELKEGFAYAWRAPHVRDLLGLLIATSLLSAPYSIFLPAFAGGILHVGSKGLGIMMTVIGAGALAGALTVGYRKGPKGMGRLAGLSALAFGISVALFALSTNYLLTLGLLLLTGFFMMVEIACVNTLLQTLAPEHLRGRIISFFVVGFIGVTPVGSLITGRAALLFGTPRTLAACGIATALAAIVFLLRVPKVRAALAGQRDVVAA
jgi:MFS family permease